jgi:hypothetical protein
VGLQVFVTPNEQQEKSSPKSLPKEEDKFLISGVFSGFDEISHE